VVRDGGGGGVESYKRYPLLPPAVHTRRITERFFPNIYTYVPACLNGTPSESRISIFPRVASPRTEFRQTIGATNAFS